MWTLPRVTEEEFRKWCDRRRYAAREQGKSFRSSFDWIFWPREEIFGNAPGDGRVLSACTEFMTLPRWWGVRYRILRGDPKRVAALIPTAAGCLNLIGAIVSFGA